MKNSPQEYSNRSDFVYEELIKAMQVIKEECIKHADCVTCPLRSEKDVECDLMNVPPVDWEFATIRPPRLLL